MTATAASRISRRICAVISTVNSVCLIDGPLLPSKVSSKCPAIMFAVNRTASVPGRIRLLIVSMMTTNGINPLNPELNPIYYLLVLLGPHHFLHVSRIRVKLLTFRLLMSYIYGAPILDVSRSHTTTQHSR